MVALAQFAGLIFVVVSLAYWWQLQKQLSKNLHAWVTEASKVLLLFGNLPFSVYLVSKPPSCLNGNVYFAALLGISLVGPAWAAPSISAHVLRALFRREAPP